MRYYYISDMCMCIGIWHDGAFWTVVACHYSRLYPINCFTTKAGGGLDRWTVMSMGLREHVWELELSPFFFPFVLFLVLIDGNL